MDRRSAQEVPSIAEELLTVNGQGRRSYHLLQWWSHWENRWEEERVKRKGRGTKEGNVGQYNIILYICVKLPKTKREESKINRP